jgi:hypothetical protein
MSQICNFFSRNFITFQDLKTYNSEIGGTSECGRGTVTTSAMITEVDRKTGYSDNPKHSCQSFLLDIYREETERRWQIPRIKRKQIYEIYKERRRII